MPISVLTDEELLEQFIQTGDQKHFDIIHGRHAEAIKIFLTRKYLNGDADAAEDMVQQTFLKLCEHHDQYDRKLKLRPWLFSVAANLTINYTYFVNRRPALSFSQPVLQTSASNHSQDDDTDFDPRDSRSIEAVIDASSHESADVIRELISLLGESDRAAVEAIYFRGQSFSEAAVSLGIPIGSIKTRVNRALNIMRSEAVSRKLEAA